VSGGRAQAREQLERLLLLIPEIAREHDGRRLDELAELVGTTVDRVVRDLEEATARAYYHHAGPGDDLQILIETDRVRIWTTGEFRRPIKLSPLEALALALGFRILAADDRPGNREAFLARAARLEARVASRAVDGRAAAGFHIAAGDEGEDGVRLALMDAAAACRCCRIEYLKAGDEAPGERVVHPYAVGYTGGGWYLIGHCTMRDAVRLFRTDRILSVSVLESRFDRPADFDPEPWITRLGGLYRADHEIEVRVRYSPGIARWIREKGPVEEQADGSVVVRHRVADIEWIVRHVLQYGAEAEVLEPAEVRRAVAEAAARVIEAGRAPATGRGG